MTYIWIKKEYVQQFEMNRFTAKPIPLFTSRTKGDGRKVLTQLGYDFRDFVSAELPDINIKENQND